MELFYIGLFCVMAMFKVFVIKFIYFVSFLVTLLFFLLALLFSFSSKSNTETAILMSCLLTVFFGVIFIYTKIKINKIKDDEIENIALKIAISHEGLVTSSEVAANSSFSLKQASEYLDKCYQSGQCEKRFTEDNLVDVYYFKSAITKDSKKSSKEILNIDV